MALSTSVSLIVSVPTCGYYCISSRRFRCLSRCQSSSTAPHTDVEIAVHCTITMLATASFAEVASTSSVL